MAARVILLMLLVLVLAACSIAKVIVIKADPVGTPIIIPQLIIIEPEVIQWGRAVGHGNRRGIIYA